MSDDVDIGFLATAFRLSGGDIRNVTVAAAYEAASRNEPVAMAHLVRAIGREYRKLGRFAPRRTSAPSYTW